MADLIVVTNQVPKEHFPDLYPGPNRWVFAPHANALMTREQVLASVAEARAIINQGELRVDDTLLDAAPHVQIIANVAIGTDNFDLNAMTARGVWATNAPDAFTESTADITMALLLGVTRRIAESDHYLRTGAWQADGMRPALWEGPLLSGRTLGIVGYGKIGKAVARRASAFGMRVLYTRSHPDDGEGYRALEDLLKESDMVSLHTPLTETTRHLIDEAMLRIMKPGSYLINLARGAVVDESALVAALQSGHLAGAGLDVFENEPIIHSGLLTLPNVVLTPHLGGAATQARMAARAVAAENVARVLHKREHPLTPVNKISPWP
ncbi:MAG: glyoxylate reductase [Verrucomicrobiales bacterium]|jgi:glyoxylate reductase